MRISRLLSVSIMVLLATNSLARAQTVLEDKTPCRKIDTHKVVVPNDFSIVWRSGPQSMSRGGSSNIIAVTAAGQVTDATVFHGRGSESAEEPSKLQLPEEAIRRIYATVAACRFFELRDSYSNSDIRGGSISGLEVTANGKTHNVSVRYYRVTRFQSISSVLHETLEEARKTKASQ